MGEVTKVVATGWPVRPDAPLRSLRKGRRELPEAKVTSESIRVDEGDAFDVSLREPAATGHRWRLTEAPAEIAVIDERYEAPGHGAPIGSAGQRIIRLRAAARGGYRLKFELAAAWGTRSAAEHCVEVDVV